MKQSYSLFKTNIKQRNFALIDKHKQIKEKCDIKFGSYDLVLYPKVFNPNYGEGSRIFLKNEELLQGNNVLDIGTGSGALAILASKQSSKIIATDISDIACKCAGENFKKLKLTEKISCRNGNLFQCINDGEKFDLILFNPPFLLGKPRSIFEYSMYDDDYNTLYSFFSQAKDFLLGSGKIFLCFGTVGDVAYLTYLIHEFEFEYSVVDNILQNNLDFFLLEIKRK